MTQSSSAARKGLEKLPNPAKMTVTLHEERASISPFGQPDWHTVFTPNRVAALGENLILLEDLSPRLLDRLDDRIAEPGHIDADLARRQQGYGRGRRMQIERDAAEIELLRGEQWA